MSSEEAIKTIEMAKAEVEWNYPMDYIIAFDTAIEALRKQIATKPTKIHINEDPIITEYYCPSCKDKFLAIRDFCKCGQKIDWN